MDEVFAASRTNSHGIVATKHWSCYMAIYKGALALLGKSEIDPASVEYLKSLGATLPLKRPPRGEKETNVEVPVNGLNWSLLSVASCRTGRALRKGSWFCVPFSSFRMNQEGRSMERRSISI